MLAWLGADVIKIERPEAIKRQPELAGRRAILPSRVLVPFPSGWLTVITVTLDDVDIAREVIATLKTADRPPCWLPMLRQQYPDVPLVGSLPRSPASLRPADGPHLPAPAASAEEPIAAIGLEPRNEDAGRHRDLFQEVSRSGIDSPQLALVTFPGGVPELSVDPGDPGDEAVGLEGAKNRACLGIDLVDLPVPILPDPERPFGPREPGAAAARRRDRGEHTAGLRIDLLDATLGDLKQVVAVERRT